MISPAGNVVILIGSQPEPEPPPSKANPSRQSRMRRWVQSALGRIAWINWTVAGANLAQQRASLAYRRKHCAACGRPIPPGRRGRQCKPCRGVEYSLAERNAL